MIFPVRQSGRTVYRLVRTQIPLVPAHDDPAGKTFLDTLLFRESGNERKACIFRAVVHDHKLKLGIALRGGAFSRLSDIGFIIIGRYDNGDERLFSHSSFKYRASASL